jgi:hypothetical protein
MDCAELSDMLYPSSTYLTALTSQASQRWLNAAFKLLQNNQLSAGQTYDR